MVCFFRRDLKVVHVLKDKNRGFALILALSLMSVTFLLVLSLISYVIVELRTAEARKATTLSRAHARLGLAVAVGELQKYAGPDQRATATGSILDDDPYTPKVDGVNHPHWTGVWRRNPSAPLYPSGQDLGEPWNAQPDYDWDPHPEVELTWLVSGNQNKKADDDDFLHPVSSHLPDPDATSDDSYSSDTVWLVNEAVARPDQRVKVLKSSVSLTHSGGTATSSDEATGAYAYWVGDEGGKAKASLPKAALVLDPEDDFLTNAGRFQVSPGPSLPLAQIADGMDLATVDKSMLGRVLDLAQLQYAVPGSDDSSASLRPYFHELTADGHGVLSDALLGGLKRDLTAGLGDDNQYGYLTGMPIFKDLIRFIKDYDPEDWPAKRWIDGLYDEMRILKGPKWDVVKSFYRLFEDVNSYDPLDASLAPRPLPLETYPNRNGEFWTRVPENEKVKRRDLRMEPQAHAITPLLLEAKVGHTLEMVPTGTSDKKGKPLYQPRIIIYPTLALWNPYNVELEAAEYELLWQPDPKFWVYATNERTKWARSVKRYERKNNVGPLWANTDVMHSLFLGSKRGRNISYGQKPGQGGGGTDSVTIGTGLRSVPRSMHRRAFFLYRYAKGHKAHESVSGWVKKGHWHTIPGRMEYRKPLQLRTNPVRMAPGEKLYFTLDKTSRFNPADEHVFHLSNHLALNHYLHYNVPRQLCPPVPADEPVTFVYTGGGIGGYWLDPFQRTEEQQAADRNPRVLGTSLYMIKGGARHPIKKINRGVGSMKLGRNGSYQDYGRADIVVADPSRVIGPRIQNRLSTFHNNPELVFLEHNPRSFVDPWHLGRGDQWWRGQETDLEDGIGDKDQNDGEGVVFSASDADESLSGDSYSDGGRIYYGYQGHSFDVAGFHRVSKKTGQDQFLSRTSRVTLFDVPRQPLMSLGSLQHVNLCYFGNSPTYAIGNSYATTLIGRNRKWSRFNQLNTESPRKRSGNEHQNTIIDYSYYANERLWDGFFFSTVPTEALETEKYPPFEDFNQDFVDAGKALPNHRMVYYRGSDRLPPDAVSADSRDDPDDGGLRDFQKAAGQLVVDGAFNVNSTSVAAWKAQLGSLSQSKLLIGDLQEFNEPVANVRKILKFELAASESESLSFPFPRLSLSTGDPVNPELGPDVEQDHWSGFASLNDDQLQRLSQEIVQEVKLRGPFLSMGDFVNRRLANPPGNRILRELPKNRWPEETEESRQGLRGALQAAIHDAGINDGGLREKYGIAPPSPGDYRSMMSRVNGLDFVPENIGLFNAFGYVAAGLHHDPTDRLNSQVTYNRRTNWGLGSHPNSKREHSHGEAPDNMLAAANGATAAMMPGWLSQADVLTPLAPVINTRSDTFRVRSYGEIESENSDVKVWCEAVVQRLPEYLVDDERNPYDGDPPHARPMEPYDDLNGNGQYDSDEPFTDYNSDGTRSFVDDYGDVKMKSPYNERFGRRFRIVRFRWLTADEV